MEELDGEAAGIRQVAEEADLHELAGGGHLDPLHHDPGPRQLHVRDTDTNLPVAALSAGLVLPGLGPGLSEHEADSGAGEGKSPGPGLLHGLHPHH